MSILSSIKEDKKLSFNHWRYRLLHWCFNVENPDPKFIGCTGLPKFLYTHYCPLFHLTNLIAILSPLVLLIKSFGVIFRAMGAVWDKVDLSWIGEFLNKIMPKPTLKEPEVYVPTKADEKRYFLKHLVGWHGSFQEFWNNYNSKFTLLAQEEVEALFNEYYPQVEQARVDRENRQKRMREILIFWTNFSRVFIKWTMNVAYIAISLAFLYVCCLAVGPVITFFVSVYDFIIWLFTDIGSLKILSIIGKILLYMMLGSSFVWVLAKTNILDTFFGACYRGFVFISPPFYLFVALWEWICAGFKSVEEFVSMFYEENCPPIVLISEEESILKKEGK
jgi:hypothetical protein